MDMPPEKDQIENLDQGYDVADLDSRLGEAADVQPEQPLQAEMQAESAQAATADAGTEQPTEAQPPEAQPEPSPGAAEPPPEAWPASATGEKGNAARAETGAEKPEVKNFHSGGPELGW